MDFPNISPDIFSLGPWMLGGFKIGPLALRWYGLMYLLGFLVAYRIGTTRSRWPQAPFNAEQVSDFLFYGFLGVVLGGRIGYVLFYHFDYFLADPSYLLRIWEGGMSFHGGLLGVVCACVYYARKTAKDFFTIADFFVPLVPAGLGFGRIGNFINGELWGRVAPADLPWAMRFPGDAEHLLRHPSQLYNALGEGLLLFLLMYFYSQKSRPKMAVSGLFALGYGSIRFVLEWFREPDAHLGLQALGLSRGQWLCLPLIAAGLIMLVLAHRTQRNANP